MFVFAVPGYQPRQAGKHHRLHAANVGAVQFQPGGSDQRANRRAGGGEEQDGEVGGTAAAKVRDTSLKMVVFFPGVTPSGSRSVTKK